MSTLGATAAGETWTKRPSPFDLAVVGHRGAMAQDNRTQAFADALRQFEDTGDRGPLTELFANSPELVRPESDRSTPQELTDFWNTYRDQFSTVRTEFSSMQEGGDLAVLEWRSKGKLAAGRGIEYDGVSVLTFDDDGRIRRFATYFDSAAFLPTE